MARFSHADPRYTAALAEMARNLSRLLDERDWSQADLVRAAKIHMPIDPATGKPGRLSADNVSNMMNGKRRPTRSFQKAVSAALGTEDWLPPYLNEFRGAGAEETRAVLTEVPDKPGFFRVFIDRELPLKDAVKLLAALDSVGGE